MVVERQQVGCRRDVKLLIRFAIDEPRVPGHVRVDFLGRQDLDRENLQPAAEREIERAREVAERQEVGQEHDHAASPVPVQHRLDAAVDRPVAATLDAFDEVDQFSTFSKQFAMLKLLSDFYHNALQSVEKGAKFEKITTVESFGKVSKMRFIPNEEFEKINELNEEITNELHRLTERGE